MNDTTARQQAQGQESQQISKLVLEEVIQQRNTLMNEIASLNVQLKVVKVRCEALEKEREKERQTEGSSDE